jgi:hypothetical protein
VLAKKDWCDSESVYRMQSICRHSDSERLNKQIATDLENGRKTIKFHRSAMIKKLGVCTVADFVRMAKKAGVSKQAGQSSGVGPRAKSTIAPTSFVPFCAWLLPVEADTSYSGGPRVQPGVAVGAEGNHPLSRSVARPPSSRSATTSQPDWMPRAAEAAFFDSATLLSGRPLFTSVRTIEQLKKAHRGNFP